MRESTMLRIYLWLILAALFFSATGCNSETAQKADNPPAKTEQQADKESTKPSGNEKDPSATHKSKKQNKKERDSGFIKITQAKEKEGPHTIHFPRLTLPDKQRQDRINDFIYGDISAFAAQSDAPVTIDYEIMWYTTDTLSIFYYAEPKDKEDKENERHLYAATFNLQRGEKRTLPNLVEIDKDFVQELKNAPFLDPKNPASPLKKKRAEVLKYLDEIGEKELIRALEHADQVHPENNAYQMYSIVRGNRVLITMKAPRSLGGYILFDVYLD